MLDNNMCICQFTYNTETVLGIDAFSMGYSAFFVISCSQRHAILTGCIAALTRLREQPFMPIPTL